LLTSHRTSNISPIQATEQPTVLAQQTISDRISTQGSSVRAAPQGQRPKYLITEETAPAPLGASLGWLMQIDGDAHRNAFLNSPWVKAVLPIRPGREEEAIKYMKRAEVAGIEGLDQKPPAFGGKSVEEVLTEIALEIKEEYSASRTPLPTGVGEAAALPEEMVWSHGYDPLEGGTKFDKDAYKIFSEWLEILPTDQVVATEYKPNVDAGPLPGH
jgi:hypothetical protein